MRDSEFHQIANELYDLKIGELLAIYRVSHGTTIVVGVKWGTDTDTLRRIETSIKSWSFTDETLIYFEFHN